jgi:hypothetical protein
MYGQKIMFKNVQELASGLNDQQLENVPTLISFMIQFISNCNDNSATESIWSTIINGISFSSDENTTDSIQLATLSSICEKVGLEFKDCTVSTLFASFSYVLKIGIA